MENSELIFGSLLQQAWLLIYCIDRFNIKT